MVDLKQINLISNKIYQIVYLKFVYFYPQPYHNLSRKVTILNSYSCTWREASCHCDFKTISFFYFFILFFDLTLLVQWLRKYGFLSSFIICPQKWWWIKQMYIQEILIYGMTLLWVVAILIYPFLYSDCTSKTFRRVLVLWNVMIFFKV